MKKRLAFAALFLTGCTFLLFAENQNIDPKADQLLRDMSNLLANANAISFTSSEVHDRHMRSGKTGKLQFTRSVTLRRPDGLWMSGVGAEGRQATVWYDGKMLTLQSDTEKVYAQVKMPSTLDEAIDYAATNLDIPMPMADIFYSSPYDSYVGPSTKGNYIKTEKIENQDCGELAFQDETLDYKIWIVQQGQPLLCQVEITYKNEPGRPKSLMIFRDWNLDAKIDPTMFTHIPPDGYQQIPILGYAPVSMEQKEN